MKSSLRTALALFVTSMPWLAMIAQSQQQEMNPRSEQRMESVQPARPAMDSANNMKMMHDADCGKMKKEEKQNVSPSGFSIYG